MGNNCPTQNRGNFVQGNLSGGKCPGGKCPGGNRPFPHTYIRTYIHMRTYMYIHTYIIGGSTGASQIIEKRPCFHFTLLYLYFHLTCYFYLLLRHFPPQCFRQVYTTVHACVVSLF